MRIIVIECTCGQSFTVRADEMRQNTAGIVQCPNILPGLTERCGRQYKCEWIVKEAARTGVVEGSRSDLIGSFFESH